MIAQTPKVPPAFDDYCMILTESMLGDKTNPQRVQPGSVAPLPDRLSDFLIGVVLAQGVYGPDGCREPANDRDLQDQANNAGDGTTDGEEGQPGK